MDNNPKLRKEVKPEIKRLVKRLSSQPKRDPARITVLLKALETVWRDYPDLRLGQIIVSATFESGRRFMCPEIFHLEDEDMLKGIKQLSNEQRNTKA